MPYADYSAVTLDDFEARNFALVPEAAVILEVDPRTLLSAIRRGEIPATKVGQQWRVPVAWLRAAAAGQAAGGDAA